MDHTLVEFARREDAVLTNQSPIVLVKMTISRWAGENRLTFAQATIDGKPIRSDAVKAPQAQLIPAGINKAISSALTRHKDELLRFSVPFTWCSELGLYAVLASNVSQLQENLEALGGELNRQVNALVDAYPTQILERARQNFVPMLGRSKFIEEYEREPDLELDYDASEVTRLGELRFRAEFQDGSRSILPENPEELRSRFGVKLTIVPIQLDVVDQSELRVAVDRMIDAPRETVLEALEALAISIYGKKLTDRSFTAIRDAMILAHHWNSVFSVEINRRLEELSTSIESFVNRAVNRTSDQTFADVWPKPLRDNLRDQIERVIELIRDPDASSVAVHSFRRRFRTIE
jgi:hypothetical protein